MDSAAIPQDQSYNLWSSCSNLYHSDIYLLHKQEVNQQSETEINFDDITESYAEEKQAEDFRYYSIHLEKSHTIYSIESVELPIYTDKAEALRIFKDAKNARLKGFSDIDDAIYFASYGGEISFSRGVSFIEQPFWKTPRSKELVKFRKLIQREDLREVRELVEENPRYLVGSGDTPTILQEGCRYNALHIAALAESPNLCDYILSVVSDIRFAERLYGSNHYNQQRVNTILDLYLNMPDKGSHETPLHFASKLGSLDVVKVLVSYQLCDKTIKNKDGFTALEMACRRAPKTLQTNKKEIIDALSVQFFVPLLRSKDNEVQACVGKTCTPCDPPDSLSNTLTPPLEVKALAGPMTKEAAEKFRKKWKTPPRNLKYCPRNRPELSDPDKGLEKVGRKLADEFGVDWKEYWSFLDSFVDLSSLEGLDALEMHLQKQYEKRLPDDIYEIKNKSNSDSDDPKNVNISDIFSVSCNKCEQEKVCNRDRVRFVLSEPLRCINSEKYDFDTSKSAHSPGSETYSKGCESIYKHKNQVFNFSPINMHKCYEIFASRIAKALKLQTKSLALSEISYFQQFLAGCVGDERFRDEDLTKCHHRLSVLIKQKAFGASHCQSTVRDLLCDLLTTDVKDQIGNGKISFDNVVKAAACITAHVVAMLSFPKEESGNDVRVDLDEMWSAAKSCKCELPTIEIDRSIPIPPLIRRLSFSDDNESSSSSDSFYTAQNYVIVDDPESPGSLSDAHDAFSEVFLTGRDPTKLDKAVMEAIEDVNFSPSDYPFISMWKTSCIRRSESSPPNNKYSCIDYEPDGRFNCSN